MHNFQPRREKDPKDTAYRNPKYLQFIRGKPCIICGQKSVAAHIRKQYWGAGTSQKPHDYVTINLCPIHHFELDITMGYKDFQNIYNKDIKQIIIDNLIEFLERGK